MAETLAPPPLREGLCLPQPPLRGPLLLSATWARWFDQLARRSGVPGPPGPAGPEGPAGPQGPPGADATLGPTLTTIEALTGTANTGLYFTGTDVAALFPLTPYARTLLDDGDQGTMRGTLGLGTLSTQNANAVAITDGRISLGGHAPTGVLDVQTSVQASDIANAYFGLRVWPKAPAGSTNTQAIRIHPSTESQAASAFRGLLVSDQPTGWTICNGLDLQISAGTGRYNIYAGGTAPSYFGGTVQVVGNVGIGQGPGGDKIHSFYNRATQSGLRIIPDADTGPGNAVNFFNASATFIGSISTTASAVSYNTTSDHRLKHAIAPLTGALARVRALRPVSFRWNQDDSSGVGFLAHELQVQIPEAVTGEPDAVDAQGNIVPQGVDHSKLVPWLTACCQELAARLDALESALGL